MSSFTVSCIVGLQNTNCEGETKLRTCDSCNTTNTVEWCDSCKKFMCVVCDNEIHSVSLP